jgi:hypothetical protein
LRNGARSLAFKSPIANQESEIRNQESAIRNRVQLEVGVTREKQKEKTPRISRIFTDLAKADIK